MLSAYDGAIASVANKNKAATNVEFLQIITYLPLKINSTYVKNYVVFTAYPAIFNAYLMIFQQYSRFSGSTIQQKIISANLEHRLPVAYVAGILTETEKLSITISDYNFTLLNKMTVESSEI